jgi:hypothetical protein
MVQAFRSSKTLKALYKTIFVWNFITNNKIQNLIRRDANNQCGPLIADIRKGTKVTDLIKIYIIRIVEIVFLL